MLTERTTTLFVSIFYFQKCQTRVYKILIKLYNITRHGLLPPYEFCVVT